jgi:uncharacterized protein (DUF697 family)
MKNGMSLKGSILIITIAGGIIAAVWGLALANTLRQSTINARVTANEVRAGNLKDDVKEIKEEQRNIRAEQREQTRKLDEILARLPR